MIEFQEKYIPRLLTACSLRAFSQLVAVTFSKQIITFIPNCRGKLARPDKCPSSLLVCEYLLCAVQSVAVSGITVDVFKGVWSSGLNLYLELVIARNGRSSRTDQQTRLQHPPAIYKPPPKSFLSIFSAGVCLPCMPHTPLFSFHLLVKIH